MHNKYLATMRMSDCQVNLKFPIVLLIQFVKLTENYL